MNIQWDDEAREAVKKVPFFVRKRVKNRVESYVAGAGRSRVTLDDVHAVKKQYLENMEEEVRGYRVEGCFGPRGCPNRAGPHEDLASRLEALLADKQLLAFLKSTVEGPLKFHHEFSITIAECPNACSRPQIKDIGITGAAVPEITDESCTMCGACVDECKEGAVRLNETLEKPEIDRAKCLDCGRCADVCPTKTISISRRAYKIMIGGKLGRHPRLAEPLPGLYDAVQVLDIVDRCVDFYKKYSTGGKRFAQLYAESSDGLMESLAGLIGQNEKGS
ncbi:MAG: 4Fe-4S dicluster domain-containing protein [Desulfobacterales bacterium]